MATFENFVKDVVFVYFEIEKVEILCQILRVASYYFQADPRHCFLTKPRVTAVESVSAPAPTPSFLYLLHTNKVNEYKEEQDAYPTVILIPSLELDGEYNNILPVLYLIL